MAINTRHPLSSAKIARWRKLRDAFEGSVAVRKQTDTYLPRPTGMTPSMYSAYLNRPEWYGATQRTVVGLCGEVFRREAAMMVPEALRADLSDVTGQRVSLDGFAKEIVSETLLMGHYGILLDFTPGDALRAGIPRWSGFPIEQVLNWGFANNEESEGLAFVVLEEKYFTAGADMFTFREQTDYRVLRLDDDGFYVVDIFRSAGTAMQDMIRVASFTPRLSNGQRLRFIPFLLNGAQNATFTLMDSPLQPLVDINYRHWRRSADYDHALHLTALPTLVITGFTDEPGQEGDGKQENRIALGAQTGIKLSNEAAKVYFLEYQGQGLGALEKALEEDKRAMATLGARLLEELPHVEEREVAVKRRATGQDSILRSLANSTSQVLTTLLQWHAWWRGFTADENDSSIHYQLNTDFLSNRLTPQEMVALVQLWQSNAISKETLFSNLQHGEVVDQGINFEMEEQRMQSNPPSLAPQQTIAPNSNTVQIG